MASRERLAEMFVYIATAYPNIAFDETRMRVWSEMLGDIDDGVLVPAVKRLLLESKFCPSIAEIRAAALGVADGDEMTASEAWGQVIREIGRVGWCGTPELSESTAAALRCIGTWRDVCSAEQDVQSANRARFLQAYEGLARRERSRRLLPPALRQQIADVQLARLGYDEPEEKADD